MARRPVRYVPKDKSRRRTWVYAAVAAFIVFDLALIGFALGNRDAEADSTPGIVPTPAAIPTSSSTPAASSTPTPAAGASTVLAVAPARMISAVDGTTAWRAVSGPCPAASADPELSTDSGAIWTSTDATGPTDVTSVQRLSAESASMLELVGLNSADCTPQFVKTFVSGDNFSSYPEQLDALWYVDPADRAVVHAPTGDTAAPCASALVLAPTSPRAAIVLCEANKIFATTDGAATWSAAATLPGAVNVSAVDTGYVAAVAGAAGCAGVQIVTLTRELDATVSGCLPVAGELTGTVALSSAGGTLWVWAGATVGRSTDGGASWL